MPDVGAAVTPLNDWFIGLVKMIVVPVVFCVVTLGIATMDNLRRAGRIGVKALGYFFALLAGLDADWPPGRQHLQTRRRNEHRCQQPRRQHHPRRRLRREDRLRPVHQQPDPRITVRRDHRPRHPVRTAGVTAHRLRSERHKGTQRPHHDNDRVPVACRVQDRRLGHAPRADRHVRRFGLGRRQIRCLQPATTRLPYPAVHRHLRRVCRGLTRD